MYVYIIIYGPGLAGPGPGPGPAHILFCNVWLVGQGHYRYVLTAWRDAICCQPTALPAPLLRTGPRELAGVLVPQPLLGCAGWGIGGCMKQVLCSHQAALPSFYDLQCCR